ncbi:MAG: spore germination protein [Marinisporobacter sp.]|jgi:spore germination protein|nr:spore germination protein [Marinisporobacter sp.]
MNEYITNRQIAFIIFAHIVGYGVMSLPKDIGQNIGTEGWIPLLVSTIVYTIFANIIVYLGYIYKNKTLFDYSQLLIGKFITIPYIIHFFISSAMVTRIFCETVKLTILLKTSIWQLSLLFHFVIFYIVIKKLKALAMICELYGMFIIVITLFLYFLISTQGEFVNIKPFFTGKNISTYLQASYQTIFSFLGIGILTVIPIHKKNNKNVFKYTICMMTFIGLFYIVLQEACLSVMGIDDIVHYKDTLLAAVRRIDIPYFSFLKRLDGILLITWIMSVFTTNTTGLYAVTFFTSKWFKNIHYIIVCGVVILLSFVVSIIPTTIEQAEEILKFMTYVGIVLETIIPIILLVITKVKKYDKAF